MHNSISPSLSNKNAVMYLNFPFFLLFLHCTWNSFHQEIVGGLFKHSPFLRRGRQPELNIFYARTVVSQICKLIIFIGGKIKMSFCEDKLKKKAAYFRLPSASQKCRMLKLPSTRRNPYILWRLGLCVH